MSKSLKLTVTPIAQRGEKIVAEVEATNLPETTVTLSAPDTVVIAPPSRQVVGSGTFKLQRSWTIEHVQPGATVNVDITVTAGSLTQTGVCRILSD